MTDDSLPLFPDRYATMGWRPVAGFGFARRRALVPLAVTEIRRAAQVMPVAFCQQAARWQAVGVMGPVAGVNLLVGPDGRWRAGFVPAVLRAHPFCLDAAQRLALSPDHPPLSLDADGADTPVHPFFADGALTPQLARTQSFLRQVQAKIAAAGPVLAQLDAQGALRPWHPPHAPAGTGGHAAAPLALWRLCPSALAELEDAAVLGLFRSGALSWLLAHGDSLHHAARFADLARMSAIPPTPPPAYQPRDAAADILAALADDLRETAP